MLHASFSTDTAGPTLQLELGRSSGRISEGPRCKAGVALRSQQLLVVVGALSRLGRTVGWSGCEGDWKPVECDER